MSLSWTNCDQIEIRSLSFISVGNFEYRCHRKCTQGVISSPGGSGPRVFSPPRDYVRSQFQGWGSAPRIKLRACADGLHQMLTFQLNLRQHTAFLEVSKRGIKAGCHQPPLNTGLNFQFYFPRNIYTSTSRTASTTLQGSSTLRLQGLHQPTLQGLSAVSCECKRPGNYQNMIACDGYDRWLQDWTKSK